MCAHPDGSLTTWLVKTPQKPTASVTPHLRTKPSAAGGTPSASNGGGTREKCKPIYKVDWKSSKNGYVTHTPFVEEYVRQPTKRRRFFNMSVITAFRDDFVIFSGGLPYDETGQMPSVTVLRGKSTTVLEMEHSIVTFVTLCDSPYISGECNDPSVCSMPIQLSRVSSSSQSLSFVCQKLKIPMLWQFCCKLILSLWICTLRGKLLLDGCFHTIVTVYIVHRYIVCFFALQIPLL